MAIGRALLFDSEGMVTEALEELQKYNSDIKSKED